jgi:hypothetical protein
MLKALHSGAKLKTPWVHTSTSHHRKFSFSLSVEGKNSNFFFCRRRLLKPFLCLLTVFEGRTDERERDRTKRINFGAQNSSFVFNSTSLLGSLHSCYRKRTENNFFVLAEWYRKALSCARFICECGWVWKMKLIVIN